MTLNLLGSYLQGYQAADRRNYLDQPAAPAAATPQNALAPTYEARAPAYGGGGTSDVGSRLMADLQRDLGLSQEQAAGVVGNLAHESGNFATLQEVSPLVEGSRGGYGYAQWTGPRRRAFEAWSAENGLDPSSYDANYGFLLHELTSTPERAVMDDLRGANDPASAARVFSNQFLRPGIPHMDNRLALAQRYYG